MDLILDDNRLNTYINPGFPRCHLIEASVKGMSVEGIPEARSARAASLSDAPDPM